jgi:hypothetical protein
MKRWWFRERKHIDQEKIQAKKDTRAEIRRLIQLGDENEFVAYLKLAMPELTKNELIEWILVFRERHQSFLRGSPLD